MTERIQRFWSIETKIERADPDSATHLAMFDGHAAVFNQETVIGSPKYGFVERIMPGAFSEVLNDDVRFLVNHDGLPLARTTNGTLVLSEDHQGLHNRASIADTSTGRDVVALLERGDINQQSFAFSIDGEEWDEVEFGEYRMERRSVTKISRLYDTSVVTYPAYEGATGGLRTVQVPEAEIRSALRVVTSDKEAAERAAEIQEQHSKRVADLAARLIL